jgi:subtilisin-like proprotein convertase family protein
VGLQTIAAKEIWRKQPLIRFNKEAGQRRIPMPGSATISYRFAAVLNGTLCVIIALLGPAAAPVTLEAAPHQPTADAWTRSESPQRQGFNRRGAHSHKPGSTFRLDHARAQTALARAPRESKQDRLQDGVEWALPMPDGTMKKFRIVESPVMAPELAECFPGLKTYRGVGVDDRRDVLRLDLHHGRLHAQVLSPEGNAYIDPIEGESSDYLSYYTETALRADEDTFECLTMDVQSVEIASASAASTSGSLQSDGMLRIYRLAVAATGEYTRFHGGTVEAGLGAIVTAVNRLNGIYESEVAIRFVLVAGNDRVVFTDPASDPYSNTDAAAMLSQNQAALDAVIGSANYDVGHVFATGGGGLAQLNSVCVQGWKGRGVTGRAVPTGDSFYIDYFAHEIGHQFSARHTFNGVSGSCNADNRHADSAYEPGSGSTIMSYSGICGSDNLQYSSDAYFHAANLVQIRNFIQSTGVTPQSFGNAVPVVDAGVDYTVPAGTPFELTATGSDADGDALTYCWEQMDLGSAAALDGTDHGSGPLFRSFPPVAGAKRVFPHPNGLVWNYASPAEVLPVTDRTLNFRVTARDNRADGGTFVMDDMQVVVTTSSGPFVLLTPNTSVEWSGEQTVVWDVAGTDTGPVSASHIDILLSTNGGHDFPIVLAEHTPNDGTELITLPEIYCGSARIKVQASDNIFFDINDVDFSIMPTSGSALVVVTETHSFTNSLSALLPGSGTSGSANPCPMQIAISAVEGVVERVTVQLHGLTHSFVDDLDILLVGPSGQNVMLLSDSSGGAMANGLELGFSDDGMVFPSDGTLASGVYQPSNVGVTGDSFPVAGPYGSTLAVFNDVDPNGIWSLYIVDDSTGDLGTLAGGWSIDIQTRRVVQQTNQPPVITPQPILYVHAGTTLVVTNEAVDPESAGALTYALRPDAPAGTMLDSNGVLTWSPAASLVGTTNICGVSVTDAGAPAMTAESEIQVVVVGLPVITSLQVTHGVADLGWSSVPNGTYRVECTDDPGSGLWREVGEPVMASGFTAGEVHSVTNSTQQFFRIRVEP